MSSQANQLCGLALLALPWLGVGCSTLDPPPPAAEPGADVPWTRYEAEDGRSTVTATPPSRVYLTPESEAAGRQLVRLEKAGDYVEVDVAQAANGLVLRYGLPDQTDAKLSLYINGKPHGKLDLTSRLAWSYGDFPWTNEPAAGRGHHFFDEAHAIIPAVVPGDVIRLQVEEEDRADYCLIDFIELEPVPPPLARPAGSMCLTEFGAMADDEGNDDEAFVRATIAARDQKRTLWIPAGTFILNGGVKGLGDVTIQGAGMWHSRLTGNAPLFHGHGKRIAVSDLAIFGEVAHRNDNFPDNAFTGNLGEDSVIERVWIEHVKCGVWSTYGTKNLRVTGCRIRNTMADGVNLCDGTRDSVVEQCHVRNTGDDALATWSPAGTWASQQTCEQNRFIHNTVELPWHANGIGLYGGKDHEVRGNLVVDTVQSGGGLLISSGHGAFPFEGTLLIEHNRFLRTGGDCYIDGRNGGLWIHAHESDIVSPIVIRDLELLESANAGITIHGPRALRNTTFEDILIQGSQENGMLLLPSAAEVDLQTRSLRIVRTPAP